MISPATMRLVGLLVILGVVAGCGERPKCPTTSRISQRIAARDASVVGTWVVDEDRLHEAFRTHLAAEVEVFSTSHDEFDVQEMARRQVRRFQGVLRSFDDSMLTITADRTFEFADGFVWGLSRRRGTWNVRGKRLVMTVTFNPEGEGNEPLAWVELDHGGLRLSVPDFHVWGRVWRRDGEIWPPCPVYFIADEVYLRRSTKG